MRDVILTGMRTTLDIDDDLLATAKQMARDQHSTVGRVISELARKSLETSATPTIRNGFEVFKSRPGAPRIDLEFVNRLRDEE
jgi:hypothetical protein